MRFLLDTQAAVWWLNGSPRMPASTRATLDDPANGRWLSAASVWELSIKRALGKYSGVDLLTALDLADLVEMPITGRHGDRAGSLAPHHRDPFDRLIVAQALLEDLVLVTSDELLARYPCAILW